MLPLWAAWRVKNDLTCRWSNCAVAPPSTSPPLNCPLAFPAILPASATLIEKHERVKKAKVGLDGRGRAIKAASVDADRRGDRYARPNRLRHRDLAADRSLFRLGGLAGRYTPVATSCGYGMADQEAHVIPNHYLATPNAGRGAGVSSS